MVPFSTLIHSPIGRLSMPLKPLWSGSGVQQARIEASWSASCSKAKPGTAKKDFISEAK